MKTNVDFSFLLILHLYFIFQSGIEMKQPFM